MGACPELDCRDFSSQLDVVHTIPVSEAIMLRLTVKQKCSSKESLHLSEHKERLHTYQVLAIRDVERELMCLQQLKNDHPTRLQFKSICVLANQKVQC